MIPEPDSGLDVAIRGDDGRLETMVTITPIDGDQAQAAAVAELVREHYQTTDDVFHVEEGDDE